MMEEFRGVEVGGVIFKKMKGYWLEIGYLGFRTEVAFWEHILLYS